MGKLHEITGRAFYEFERTCRDFGGCGFRKNSGKALGPEREQRFELGVLANSARVDRRVDHAGSVSEYRRSGQRWFRENLKWMNLLQRERSISWNLVTWVGGLGFIAIVLWINPVPFFRPEFWAEDGMIFFSLPFIAGVKSIFFPAFGSLNFLARLVAWIASYFPIVYAPVIYAWSSLVLFALVMTRFLSARMDYLVPSRWVRLLLLSCWALGPGTPESLGNICNLYYLLMIHALISLLGRLDPLASKQLSFRSALGYFFIGISSPVTAALSAFCGWLALTEKRRDLWIISSIFVLTGALNLLAKHSAFWTPPESYQIITQYQPLDTSYVFKPDEWPKIFFERTLDWSTLAPIFGKDLAESLMSPGLFTLFLSIAVWVLLAGVALGRVPIQTLKKPELKKTASIILALLGTVGTVLVLTRLGRPGDSWRLVPGRLIVPWVHRYMLVPGWVGSLVLVLATNWMPKRVRVPVQIGLLGLLITQNFLNWQLPVPRPDLHWGETAAELESQLHARAANPSKGPLAVGSITVHPLGWATFSILIP